MLASIIYRRSYSTHSSQFNEIKMASSFSSDQMEPALRVLLDLPRDRPPPGVKPNLENPSNLDLIASLTLSLCTFFVSITVLSRFYTKAVLIRSIASEDCKSVSLPVVNALRILDAVATAWVSPYSNDASCGHTH